MANTKKTKQNPKKEATFEMVAFLNSKIYGMNRDLLDAILEDGKKYTTKEVNELLKKELNRKVEC